MNAAAVRSPILAIAVVDKKFDLSAAAIFLPKNSLTIVRFRTIMYKMKTCISNERKRYNYTAGEIDAAYRKILSATG